MVYATDVFYLLAAPFFLPPYLYKIIFRKKYRESTRGMLGVGLASKPWPHDAPGRRLWLHAVSVGEVVAGKAVLAEWIKIEPDTRIVVSTVTETGQKKAREMLKEAREFIYYPIDFSPVVNRFLAYFDPKVYIFMETEIWPNFLRSAGARGVKIFLANGKLSERSFAHWMKVRSLFRGTFDAITAACVQTDRDREKFTALLGRPECISVTGNCKFDSSGSPITEKERAELLARLKLPHNAPVIVVGSTHSGEEDIILNAWEVVRRANPDVRLIIAPRHPERFEGVARQLAERGIRFSRFTEPAVENPEVILVDTIGELAILYGLGQFAIVGGSFVPVGGHNLLEAAVHSIPVLYGPHMHKQPEILKIFQEGGGGIQVSAKDLASQMERLLGDDDERRRLGEIAALTARENRGSAGRTVEFIRKFL
jgi:3-deoxy-D-manno-octulosonic-acid transferase